MDYIFLRPHHINCIYFFEGLGYDEKFTQNMKNIIDKLSKNKLSVKFVKNCDCLCKYCPNKINNCCKTEEHIKQLDELTITNYNLDLNKIYSFQEIYDNYYKNFDKIKFLNICQSCEWFKSGVCSMEKIKNF